MTPWTPISLCLLTFSLTVFLLPQVKSSKFLSLTASSHCCATCSDSSNW